MLSGRVYLCKKRYKSTSDACTGNASLDFLPSLIHDSVSIFRKVTAENENLPGPQLVYKELKGKKIVMSVLNLVLLCWFRDFMLDARTYNFIQGDPKKVYPPKCQ